METVENIAVIVGLVRDVLLLLVLAVALILILMVMDRVRRLLSSAQATAETVQEAVQTISEKVVEPAAGEVGTSRNIGRIVGFALGMFRRKKRSD